MGLNAESCVVLRKGVEGINSCSTRFIKTTPDSAFRPIPLQSSSMYEFNIMILYVDIIEINVEFLALR